MVLRHKVQINCDPEEIWTFLSNPDLLQSWNRRIKAIVPVTAGEWAEGTRFRLRYEIEGSSSNYLAEIFEYQEPVRMVIHLTGGIFSSRGYIQEIYRLARRRQGTLLRLEIEIHYGRKRYLRGPFSALLGFFKWRQGNKYLKALKTMVENNQVAREPEMRDTHD